MCTTLHLAQNWVRRQTVRIFDRPVEGKVWSRTGASLARNYCMASAFSDGFETMRGERRASEPGLADPQCLSQLHHVF